jgi:hypothetical protein
MKAVIGLVFLALTAAAADAQVAAGDWQGTLHVGPAELRLVMHVARSDKGELTVTIDSPDQGAKGIQTTAVSLVDGAFKFDVPTISGAYAATLNAAGSAMSGTWSQAGNALPLDFAKGAPVPERTRVVKGSDIDGDWTGAIAGALDVIIHIVTYEDGLAATMDVPAQGASGLPMTAITRAGSSLQLELKQIAASFAGTLNAELSTVTGDWSQLGNSVPLVLQRTKKP